MTIFKRVLSKMTKDDSHPTPAVVVIERDGVHHTGSYTVDGDVITVTYQGRHTQPILLGSSPAATLAKALLAELISEDTD